MGDYRELSALMEKTVHKYNQMEKMKRAYASDLLLTQAEIHTVVAIGENPDVNVTGLAKVQGITKGAASQMVYRLVAKGLVVKGVSPRSDSEVVLSLTDEGRREKAAHDAFHADAGHYLSRIIDDVPQDVLDQMIVFLEAFDEALDTRLDPAAKR